MPLSDHLPRTTHHGQDLCQHKGQPDQYQPILFRKFLLFTFITLIITVFAAPRYVQAQEASHANTVTSTSAELTAPKETSAVEVSADNVQESPDVSLAKEATSNSEAASNSKATSDSQAISDSQATQETAVDKTTASAVQDTQSQNSQDKDQVSLEVKAKASKDSSSLSTQGTQGPASDTSDTNSTSNITPADVSDPQDPHRTIQDGHFTSNRNATWRLTYDGTLYISGAGKVTEFGTSVPWYKYRNSVKAVVTSNSAGYIAPTNLSAWFNGYSNLVSANMQGISTRNTTTLDSLFANCQNLTTVTGMSSWSVEKVTSFANMFSGSYLLGELDLSGWDMTSTVTAQESQNGTPEHPEYQGRRTAQPQTTNMFLGAAGLRKLTLGDKVELDSSSLGVTLAGAWRASSNGWLGSNADMLNRYSWANKDKRAFGVVSYLFDATKTGGSFTSNPGAWWEFVPNTTEGAASGATGTQASTTQTGALVLYGGSGYHNNSTTITEINTNVPWRSVVKANTITAVRAAATISPTSMANWFFDASYYDSLKSFDGANFDLSQCVSLNAFLGNLVKLTSVTNISNWNTRRVTDFSYAFYNLPSLAALDISGWDMTSTVSAEEAAATNGANYGRRTQAPSVANMFYNMIELNDIALSGTSIINGTSLSVIPTRSEAKQGVWRTNKDNFNTWFGTSNNLNTRFTATGTSLAAMHYYWDSNVLAGRFTSNDAAWWTYIPSGDDQGHLYIGVEADAQNKVVTEAGYTALPWRTRVTTGGVKKVTTHNGLMPQSLSQWFYNPDGYYRNLESFDGSGLDTSNTTALTSLFQYNLSLTSITGIHNWNTAKVTDFSSVFNGVKNLTSLDISGWNMVSSANYVTAASMLANMVGLKNLTLGDKVCLASAATTGEALLVNPLPSGTWLMSTGWRGSSLDLMNRYNWTRNAQRSYGVTTYTWDITLEGGSFISNPNTYWTFNSQTGELALYGTGDATTSQVTEQGVGALPWYTKFSTQVSKVTTHNKLAPQSMYQWFYSYPKLVSFDGAGIETVYMPSSGYGFTSLFQGDSALTSVSNISQWNVSNVSNFSSLFQGASALTSLDISGWDLRSFKDAASAKTGERTSLPTLTNMLNGTNALSTLVLGKNVFLTGSTLESSIATRGDAMGAWHAANPNWTGTSSNLVARYSSTNPDTLLAKETYVWQPGIKAGRFTSNHAAWWDFDVSSGTLTIGLDEGAASKTVTEYNTTLPWRAATAVAAGLIKKVVTTGAGLAPTNLSSWFNDVNYYASLVSIDLAHLDPSQATTLNAFICNAPQLAQVTGISSWNVRKIVDFSYLFSNCFKLTSIDISSWDLTSVGAASATDVRTSAATVTYMFNTVMGLTSLTLGNTSKLEGSGLASNPHFAATQGSWTTSKGLAKNTTELIAAYPLAGNTLGTLTWTWTPKDQVLDGAFAENNNVWWKFEPQKNTLTIYVKDQNQNKYLSTATKPWESAGVAMNNVWHVVFQGGVQVGYVGNTQGWFANYTSLKSFDGTGFDPSATTTMGGMFYACVSLTTVTGIGTWDLSHLQIDWAGPHWGVQNFFAGCTSLESVDLTGWNFLSSSTRGIAPNALSSVFYYCTSLKSITLGGNSVLPYMGLSSIITRQPGMGSWVAGTPGSEAWAGTGADLERKYPVRTTNDTALTPAASVTYTWVEGYLAGRFELNDNCWWTFDQKTGTLTYGAGEGTNKLVADGAWTREYGSYNRPWTTAGVPQTSILHVKTKGGIQIYNLASQFSGATNLIDYDGSGVDASQTVSTAFMFYSATSLVSVKNIALWNVSNLQQVGNDYSGCWNMFGLCSSLVSLDLSGWDTRNTGIGSYSLGGMLQGCTSLSSLTLGPNVVLAGSTLESISTRTATLGSWVVAGDLTQNGWAGSGANLNARYKAAAKGADGSSWSGGSGLTKAYTYEWRDGFLAGRFVNNDNCWWTFDTATGTLAIGAGSGSDKFIEAGIDFRPWLSNGITVAEILHVTTHGGIQFFQTGGASTSGMFYNLSNLKDFDGAGFDLSQTQEMGYMFYACTSLVKVTGVASWNVSNVNLNYGWAYGFHGLFAACSALTSIDISGWDMRTGSGTRALSRAEAISDIFTGCTSLVSLTLGANNLMQYATISSIATRAASLGSWYAGDPTKDGWAGSGANLEARYPLRSENNTDLTPTNPVTYVWRDGFLAGRFANNDNSWWTFDTATGTLALGTGSGSDTYIEEGISYTPWTANGVAVADVQHVTTHGGIQFYTTMHMFENYTNLLDFDGSGMKTDRTIDIGWMFSGCSALVRISNIANWDTSKVVMHYRGEYYGFAYVFNGCASLNELDISGWDLRYGSEARGGYRDGSTWNLFLGCTSLSRITLGPNVVLVSAGNLSSIATRAPSLGSWIVEGEEAEGYWTSANIEQRYPMRKEGDITPAPQRILTYVWQPNILGGRFSANLNCWWSFIPSTGILTYGAGSGDNKLVDNGDNKPWLANGVNGSDILHVKTKGGIQFYRMNGQLQGALNLLDYDGAGVDTSKTINMSMMFNGDSSLVTVSNIQNWDITTLTADSRDWSGYSYMFSGCSSLTELDISGWDMRHNVNTQVNNYSVAGFIAGTTSLTTLKLGPYATLQDSALATDSGVRPGVWIARAVENAPAGTTSDIKVDDRYRTPQLVSAYPFIAAASETNPNPNNGHGTVTWEFVPGTWVHFMKNVTSNLKKANGSAVTEADILGTMETVFVPWNANFTLPGSHDTYTTAQTRDPKVYWLDGFWLRWWNETVGATYRPDAAARATEYDAGTNWRLTNFVEDTYLYAVWIKRVRVGADFEAGTTDNVSGATNAIRGHWAGDDVELSDNGFRRYGYDYDSWSVKGDTNTKYVEAELYRLGDGSLEPAAAIRTESIEDSETGTSEPTVLTTFNANWLERNSYGIEYDLAGGRVVDEQGNIYLGIPSKAGLGWESTGLTPSTTPSWLGHDFRGWRYLDDAGVWHTVDANSTKFRDLAITTLKDGTQVVHDAPGTILKLVALWTYSDVTLTYVTNTPGTVVLAKDSSEGTSVSETFVALTQTPQGAKAVPREGYYFVGWTNSANGEIIKEATLTPELLHRIAYRNSIWQNTTFTAMFAPITYTVHFDPNGGEGTLPELSLSYNVWTQLTPVAGTGSGAGGSQGISRKGYAFIGWNTLATPSDDTAGTWYKDAASVRNLTATAGEVVTLYAQWKALTTTFTYGVATGGILQLEGNSTSLGNAWSETVERLDGTPSTVVAAPRAGYRFVEWRDATTGSSISKNPTFVPKRLPDGLWPQDPRYLAVFAPYTYTVEFLPGKDGVEGHMDPQSFTFDASQTLNANAYSLVGYTFSGWRYEPQGGEAKIFSDQEKVTNLTTQSDAQLTLTAIWTPITYIIEFYAQADDATGHTPKGVSTNRQTVTYDVATHLAKNAFVKPGHAFMGWASAPGGQKVYEDAAEILNLTSIANAVIPLYALWSKKSYEVNFVNDPSQEDMGKLTGDTTLQVEYLGRVSSVPTTTPKDADHKLLNWTYVTTKDDGTSIAATVTDPSLVVIYGPTTFTAHWAIRALTIAYARGDHGTFTEYDTNKTYWVNPASSASIPVYAGETDTKDSNPKNAGNPTAQRGWVFAGWRWIDATGNVHNFTTTSQLGTSIAALGNVDTVVFVAVWRPSSQVLSFDVNGGIAQNAAALAERAQDTGTPVALPGASDVLRRGYTFSGWGFAPGGAAAYSPGATIPMFAMDTTLFALWTPKAYILHVDPQGGIFTSGKGALDAQNNKYNLTWDSTNITDGVPTPVRQGYTFKGWYTKAPSDGATGAASQGILVGTNTVFYELLPKLADGGINDTANTIVTLYAQWQEAEVSLVYKAVVLGDAADPLSFTTTEGGATNPKSEKVLAVTGTPKGATASANPGYTFLWWADAFGGVITREAAFVPSHLKGSIWSDNTVFYAVFTPITYTVRYEANGGTGSIADEPMTFGIAATLTQNGTGDKASITREGYTFAGWTTQQNGGGSFYGDGATVQDLTYVQDDIVTLYALWTALPQTLTFDANGGQGASFTEQHLSGETLILAQNPGNFTREGHRIYGWSEDPSGSGINWTPGDAYTMPARATTLYALWTPITYTIRFEAGAPYVSGKMDDQKLGWGEVRSLTLNRFKRNGYAFLAWATSLGGSEAYTDGEQVTNLATTEGAVVRLYALWAPSTNRVSFVSSDTHKGTVSASDQFVLTGSVADATRVNLKPVGTYLFSGWQYTMQGADGTVKEGAVAALSDLVIEGDTVFSVLWGQTSNVSYLPGEHGDSTFKAGVKNVTLFEPLVEGDPIASVAVYAGPKDSEGRPLGAEGWTFDYWAATDGTKYPWGSVLPLVKTGSNIFVAHWTAGAFTLIETLNLGVGAGSWSDGTTADKTGSYAVGNAVVLPDTTALSRKGYTFAGWGTSADGSAAYKPGATYTMPAHAVTLFAIWQKKSYAVAYNTGGAPATIDTRYDIAWEDTGLIPAVAPIRLGYTFDGWFTAAQGDALQVLNDTAFSVLAAGDESERTITLFARWSEKQITLYFKVDPQSPAGGALSRAQTGPFAGHLLEAADSCEATANTGYTFSGWYDAAGNLVSRNASFRPHRNTGVEWVDGTFYTARFVPNNYVVIYNAPDADEASAGIPSQTFTYDKEAALSQVQSRIVKRGYTFKGWSRTQGSQTVDFTDGALVKNLASGAEGDKTVLLYAIWEPQAQKLTYNAGEGSGSVAAELQNKSYPAGSQITLANAQDAAGMTRVGYTLVGWDATPDKPGNAPDYELGAHFVMPTTDTVLYAHWKQNSYYVRFAAGEGTGKAPAASAHAYTQTWLVPANTWFTRSGYSFSGWQITGEGVQEQEVQPQDLVSSLTAVANGNVTFTAMWNKLALTLTWQSENTNHGTVGDSVPKTIGWGEKLAAGTAADVKPAKFYYLSGWTYQMFVDGNELTGELSPTSIYELEIKGSTIFTAHFSPVPEAQRYTLSFDAHVPAGANLASGSGDMDDIEMVYGESIVLPKNTYRVNGYTFKGWTLQADGTGASFADGASFMRASGEGAARVVLYAQWTRNLNYTVRIVNNHTGDGTLTGNAAYLTQTVGYGDYLQAGDVAVDPDYTHVKNGKRLSGWEWKFTLDDGSVVEGTTAYGEPFTSIKVLGNGVISPVFMRGFVDITFDANGGTFDDGTLARTLKDQLTTDKLTLPANQQLTRAGYELVGWAFTMDGAPAQDSSGATYFAGALVDMPKTSTTLYAVWQEQTVLISFVNSNPKAGTLSTQAASAGEGVYTMRVGVASGKVYDERGNAVADAPFEAQATALAGYTVQGWKVSNTSDTLEKAALDINDLTRLAKKAGLWTSTTFELIFSENAPVTFTYEVNKPNYGSVLLSSEKVAPATGSPRGTTATPLAGYRFVKWVWVDGTRERDFTGNDAATLTPAAIGDLALKPMGIWTNTTFKAIFEPMEVAVAVEYYFQNLDGSYQKDTAATSSQHALVGSLVRIDTDGVLTQTLDGTQTICARDLLPARTGYYFSAQASAPSMSALVAPDGTTTLKLYYDLVRVHVRYVYEGDVPATALALPNEKSYLYGDTVHVAAVPPHTQGYTFSGWKNAKVAAGSTSFVMPAEDVVLTGTWTRNTYRVTFVAGAHGSLIDARPGATGGALSQAYGTPVVYASADSTPYITVTSANPSQHIFYEWTYKLTLDDGSITTHTTTNPAEVTVQGDLEFSALWGEPLVIAYLPGTQGGFAAGDPGTIFEGVVPGSALSASAYAGPMAQDGQSPLAQNTSYVFAGWKWTSAAGEKLTTATGEAIPAGYTHADLPATAEESLTFTALWSGQPVMLTINPSGGILTGADASGMHAAGSQVVLPGVGYATRKGYKLVGFSKTSPSDAAYHKDIELGARITMPDTAYNLWLFWQEEDPVTIYYEAGIGGVVDKPSEEVSPVTGTPHAVATAQKGYVFSKWVQVLADGTLQDVAGAASFAPLKAADALWIDGTRYRALFVPDQTQVVIITYQVRTSDKVPPRGSISREHETAQLVQEHALGSTATALDGYVFAGWWRVDGGKNELITSEATLIPSKINGYFEAATYEARFSRALVPITIEHYFQNVSRDGYDHESYNDTVLSAENGATVTIDTSGRAQAQIDAATFDLGIVALTKPGFSFDTTQQGGWTGVVNTQGLVLKLYYQRLSYKVRYVFEGDIPADIALPAEQTVVFGDVAYVAAAPVKEGWVARDWQGTQAFDAKRSFIMPAQDVIYTLKWDKQLPVDLTITFVFEDLKPDAQGKATYSAGRIAQKTFKVLSFSRATINAEGVLITNAGSTQNILGMVVPEVLGFTFAANVGTDERTNIEVLPDGSTVLKVYFARNSYLVHYEIDSSAPFVTSGATRLSGLSAQGVTTQAGGIVLPADRYYRFEEQVTVAPRLVVAGYNISDWLGAAYDAQRHLMMPAKDVTLYVTWSKIEDKPTDPTKPGGGTTDPTDPTKPGGGTTDPKNPTKPEGGTTDPTDPTKPGGGTTDPNDPNNPNNPGGGTTDPNNPDNPNKPGGGTTDPNKPADTNNPADPHNSGSGGNNAPDSRGTDSNTGQNAGLGINGTASYNVSASTQNSSGHKSGQNARLNARGNRLPQTGDNLPQATMPLFIGIILLLLAILARKKQNDEDEE